MVSPRICVSIAARSATQAADEMRRVEPHEPDLIELRLDYLDGEGGLDGVGEATRTPLIATNRRVDQGGLHEGSEDERIARLMEACEAGFDYVDLELNTPSLRQVTDDIRGQGVKIIVSHHDILGTPSKSALRRILQLELGFGPDICKIVGTAESFHDNLAYLEFLEEKPCPRLICFGMGELGMVSRVFSPLFGGEFTYASPGKGSECAPGQLSIASMREIYRILGI